MNQPSIYIAQAPLIAANDDSTAIALYLNQRDDQGGYRFSPATINNYTRDIRRYVLWLNRQDKTLSDLTVNDIADFADWLKAPPDELIERNCKRPISHPEWRPFYIPPTSKLCGLTPSSIRQQMAALRALYAWLMNAGYLTRNPFALVRTSRIQNSINHQKRHLFLSDLQLISRYLDQATPLRCESNNDYQMVRWRWIWYAYLFSGLRISELIKLDTGKIHTKQIKSKKIWLLSVLGKSRKSEDQQVIPERFVKELQRYRSCLGLDPWPEMPSSLLLSSKGNGPISTRAGAHTIFKEFMNHIAEQLASINEFDSAQRIKACSVHWLRHSFVTTLLDLTNDMPAVNHLARHRDFKTTMTYDTSEYESLAAQLDQLVESIR